MLVYFMLVQIGASWCSLERLSGVWCRLVHISANLVQFEATWCPFVQIGAVWCNLVQIRAV